MPTSRRPRSAVRREYRITVKLTKEEKAAVECAAERSGKAVGAWVGEIAMLAAELREMTASQAQLEILRELIRIAGLLRRAGTLLNQAVARLNATGVPSPDLAPSIAFLMKVMARVDDVAIDAKRRLRWPR